MPNPVLVGAGTVLSARKPAGATARTDLAQQASLGGAKSVTAYSTWLHKPGQGLNVVPDKSANALLNSLQKPGQSTITRPWRKTFPLQPRDVASWSSTRPGDLSSAVRVARRPDRHLSFSDILPAKPLKDGERIPIGPRVPGAGLEFYGLSQVELPLLHLLVDSARIFPAEVGDGRIWLAAWRRREELPILENAIPPNPNLASAIISVARTKPQLSDLAVLKAALLVAALADRLASEVASAAIGVFGQRSINWAPPDPYAIDRLLFEELVAESYVHADPYLQPPAGETAEIFERAWDRRSNLAPWPIEEPQREYVAAIVDATRASTPAFDLQVIANRAKATLLVHLLGGGELFVPQTATSPVIETPLLDAILVSADLRRSPNYSQWAYQVAYDESHCGGIPLSACQSLAKARYRQIVRGYLDTARDLIWTDALELRSQHWEWPWPPNPGVDRQLLEALIVVAWSNSHLIPALTSDDGADEARHALLFTALDALGRIEHVKGEHIAKVQSPFVIEGTVAVIVVVVGIIGFTSAVVGALIEYCTTTGVETCASFARWVADLFESTPKKPMDAPPRRGGGGSTGRGSTGGGSTGETSGGRAPATPPARKPVAPRDVRDNSLGLALPETPPGGHRPPGRGRSAQSEISVSKTPTITIDTLAATEHIFFQRLCAGMLAIGHGFQAKDLLLVMLSETNGTMDPRAKTGGAMGLNQIILSELHKVRPGMTEQEYRSLSRADQIDVVIDYFNRYIQGNYAGGAPVTASANGNWSASERASVLYAMNLKYPGSGRIDTFLNSSSFNPDLKMSNLTSDDIKANPALDKTAPFGVVTLGDLKYALDQRKGTAAWRLWSGALSLFCDPE